MARREDIVNTIWDDLDHLSDDAFMLYVWSWTNQKCGMAGIYKVARRKLVEGRFDEERLTAALAELEADDSLFYFDGVLWNKARVGRLSMISDNIAKSIAKDLAEIGSANPLLTRFIERYGKHPKLEPHLSLMRPSVEGQENPPMEPDGRGSPEGRATLPGYGRGRGSGQDIEVPTDLQPIVERLDRVTFSRSLPSPDVPAVLKACADFDDRDLEVESDKFAHYYTDGAGENRHMKDVVATWRNWLRSAPTAGKARSQRGSVASDIARLESEKKRLRAEEAAA